MDLRYRGQNYELEVGVAPGLDAPAIRRHFTERHRRRYDYETGEPVECVNLRVSAVVPSNSAAPPAAAEGPSRRGRVERRVFFYGHGWVSTPVYAREAIGPEARLAGPAVLQDAWSTIVVQPAQALRCDAAGLLWIEAA
jgi:N-methylhydantoinase A